MKIARNFSRIASMLFGGMSLFMAGVVSLEVVLRKLCDISLQGTNELSGYIMAIMSCVAAAVAVQGRNHIRIDILHYLLPRKIQAVLNVLASVCLSMLSWILLYAAWRVLADSYDYQSTSATPWATPLIYPQGLWVAALMLFCAIATGYALRALWLLVRGDTQTLCDQFQPKASRQEAEEEMLQARERMR